eukprot:687912-Pyramimonas_sp.AAC.2
MASASTMASKWPTRTTGRFRKISPQGLVCSTNTSPCVKILRKRWLSLSATNWAWYVQTTRAAFLGLHRAATMHSRRRLMMRATSPHVAAYDARGGQTRSIVSTRATMRLVLS